MLMPAGSDSIGKFIVPYPHMRQVLVPEEGCRVILGTDGLWDFLAAAKNFSSTGSVQTGVRSPGMRLKSTLPASSHICELMTTMKTPLMLG